MPVQPFQLPLSNLKLHVVNTSLSQDANSKPNSKTVVINQSHMFIVQIT
jgi:hypothetical protein